GAFLGNTYVGCHTDTNGLKSAHGLMQTGTVSHGGNLYFLRTGVSHATAIATTPGTNDAVWRFISAGAPSTNYPAWSATPSVPYVRWGSDPSGQNLYAIQWGSNAATPSNPGQASYFYNDGATGDFVWSSYGLRTPVRFTGASTARTYGRTGAFDNRFITEVD